MPHKSNMHSHRKKTQQNIISLSFTLRAHFKVPLHDYSSVMWPEGFLHCSGQFESVQLGYHTQARFAHEPDHTENNTQVTQSDLISSIE